VNKNIHISSNYESTKMADHILEMAGLGLLCGFVSQKYIAKAGYLC